MSVRISIVSGEKQTSLDDDAGVIRSTLNFLMESIAGECIISEVSFLVSFLPAVKQSSKHHKLL